MEKSTIGEILKNSERLLVPDYCGEYFWNDVEHFFQILSESAQNEVPSGINVFFLEKLNSHEFLAVDGIKRFVGASLFLYALCECYKKTSEKNEDARQKILSRYLLSDDTPKIRLNGADGIIFDKIILSQKLTDEEKESPLFLVLHKFWELIKENNIGPSKLFKSFCNIEAIVFYTNSQIAKNRDIYSILNSNNGFNQTKLIKSYLKEEDSKSETIWAKVEEQFNDDNILQCFLADFLSINFSGCYRCETELYKYFKMYYGQLRKYRSTQEILDTVKNFAEYYSKIIHADFDDFEIKKYFITLNENHGQDSYAYMMEVLDDFKNSHISREMFLEILAAVNVFILNREQTGAKIDFRTLSEELNKMLTIKDYQPLGEFVQLTINEINKNQDFELQY